MIYVVSYFIVLVVAAVLLARRADRPAGVVRWALVVAIVGCSIYQLANYILHGADPFIELAVAIQFLVSFALSLIAGAVAFMQKRR